MNPAKTNGHSKNRILLASLVGTTIEFFDFYIYATAAVLVFPKLFFPAADPKSATLQSLATFALAFFARPLGAALFGHFGDRRGRKATLVAALMTMGPSTVAIGLLPTYQSIGVAAPILLRLYSALARVWGLAVNGAGPCCWRRKMRRKERRHGMGCFRSWGRRSGLSFPAAAFSSFKRP